MYTASFLQDPDFIRVLYILAFGCFIFGLRLLNHPRTARRGNLIAAVGMAIAVGATLLWDFVGDYGLILLGIAIGTAVGIPAARSVKMTAMPQMVALFNGVGGGAVALISFGARAADPDPVRGHRRLDLLLGLEHRVRQAAGGPARAADPAAGPAVPEHRPAARGGRRRDRDRGRHRVGAALRGDPARRGGARQHVRAADRRS
jgi:NAD(P) transhydrogenase beta subunit